MDYIEALKVLGLSRGCSIADARRAYRRLAVRYHPDRFRTFAQQAKATRQFIRVKEAHDVLLSHLSARAVPDETPPPAEREASEYPDSAETRSNSGIEHLDPFFWLDWLMDRLMQLETISEKNRVLELLTLPLLTTFSLSIISSIFI